MDVPKLPRLRNAIEDLQDYVSTLSQQEKVATNMENFNYENYEQAATPMKNRQYMPDELAETDRIHELHCRTMIETLKEDVAKYHRKENGEDLPSKIPRLLSRYIKLPDLWRFYISKRLNPEFAINEIGNSLGDIWIFGRFALIANNDETGDAWDKELNEKMISKFESMINEIERAQATPQVEITSSPMSDSTRISTLPEGF